MEPGPRWNRSPYQDSSSPHQSSWQQSPRTPYHHQNQNRGGRSRGRAGFGYYGSNNSPQGRFRSPNNSPHNFSPRGNYNQHQPRFIDFNNSYGNSPNMSPYQNQKPRHFSPRSFHNSPNSFGQQQFRSNKNRGSRDNIESWVLPEMWTDPWAELKGSHSNSIHAMEIPENIICATTLPSESESVSEPLLQPGPTVSSPSQESSECPKTTESELSSVTATAVPATDIPNQSSNEDEICLSEEDSSNSNDADNKKIENNT